MNYDSNHYRYTSLHRNQQYAIRLILQLHKQHNRGLHRWTTLHKRKIPPRQGYSIIHKRSTSGDNLLCQLHQSANNKTTTLTKGIKSGHTHKPTITHENKI